MESPVIATANPIERWPHGYLEEGKEPDSEEIVGDGITLVIPPWLSPDAKVVCRRTDAVIENLVEMEPDEVWVRRGRVVGAIRVWYFKPKEPVNGKSRARNGSVNGNHT